MKRLIRIIVVVGVFAVIFIAMVSSSVKQPDFETQIWNKNMTLGDPETAVRHYVVYTDLMCPYCNYYARIIKNNEEDLKNYLAEHKILYEVRVTDMLYEGSGVELSRPAAEAAYCAAAEDKFWDFYHLALDSIFSDYYDKGIGYSKTAPLISDMTRDYWLNVASEAGLGETFADCYNNRRMVAEVSENTIKASQTAAGLPYYSFGRFSTGGFDPSWDWSIVKQMFDYGLK